MADDYTPSVDEVAKTVDEFGAVLTYAHDPVDGSRVVVLTVEQIAPLIAQVRAKAYKDAEDAAADALRTWWLRETLPEDDTDSVMDVRRAIRAAQEVRRGSTA